MSSVCSMIFFVGKENITSFKCPSQQAATMIKSEETVSSLFAPLMSKKCMCLFRVVK